MNDLEKKLYNIQKLIVEDAGRRKEKVIAVDSKTFGDVKGKEVRIRISSVSLESMKRDVKEYEEKYRKVEND